MGNNFDLAVALLGDLDCFAKVADTAVDLDHLVQELLESRDIEDLVTGRLGGVDDELLRHLGRLALLLFGFDELSLLLHAIISGPR